MNRLLCSMAIILAAALYTGARAEEPPPDRLQLKDGSTLYLHPDGTGRMVDQHGKPMSMADGVEMELADGRVIMMKNKKVWVRYGPPGKERTELQSD